MQSESGSSPIESILGSVLLLLPINMAIGLFQIQSDQLLAETIGRNALRSAVLDGRDIADYQRISRLVAEEIAQTWGHNGAFQIQLTCTSQCEKGSHLNLAVRVGNATAVQSQVLDR